MDTADFSPELADKMFAVDYGLIMLNYNKKYKRIGDEIKMLLRA